MSNKWENQFREQLVRDKKNNQVIDNLRAVRNFLSDEWRRELWEGCYVEYARSTHLASNHYYSLTFFLNWLM